MDQQQTGKIVLAVAAAGMLVLPTQVTAGAATKLKPTVVSLKPSTSHTYISGPAVTYKVKASGLSPVYRWYLKKSGKAWTLVSKTSTYKFHATASYHHAVVKATAKVTGKSTTTIPSVHVYVVSKTGTMKAANGDVIRLGSQVIGDDYPWKSKSMSSLSVLRYYARYCTDFVAWRLNVQAGTKTKPYRWTWGNLTPKGGNANKWPSQWANQTDTTPQLGAVAWWKPGHGSTLGHVAIVSAIYADGSILLEEYNWTHRGGYDTRRVAPGDKYYPDKFIHIQDW